MHLFIAVHRGDRALLGFLLCCGFFFRGFLSCRFFCCGFFCGFFCCGFLCLCRFLSCRSFLFLHGNGFRLRGSHDLDLAHFRLRDIDDFHVVPVNLDPAAFLFNLSIFYGIHSQFSCLTSLSGT